MALVSDVAGAESALALYDVGKLEFLYVTRLPSAKTMENALWRTRGTYQPRAAAGTPFYVRVDPESKRVVAFGVRDQRDGSDWFMDLPGSTTVARSCSARSSFWRSASALRFGQSS